MGTYRFPTKTKTYNRKRNYNLTYNGRPTKRRIKNSLNQGKSIVKVMLVAISIIIAYNIIAANSIYINGAVADNKATSFVEPSAERVVNQPPPARTVDKTVEQQIRDIAREHNFKWEDYLVRLAKCENIGLNPKAINNKGNIPYRSIDRGIFQINNYWHKEISDECAFSVKCSTEFAIRMINAGRQSEWMCDKYAKR